MAFGGSSRLFYLVKLFLGEFSFLPDFGFDIFALSFDLSLNIIQA
ncbi:hypothetical protein SynA1544_00992 [Synechococcus sp. A15-44]|nr:hypothetical protein SynA1544_00992 [Synechococcus sp. A15-44]